MKEEEDNIEKFFKSRLEGTNIAYQESDWVMLEQRLDAAAIPVVTGVPTYKVVIGGAILVVTAFFAGWLLRDVVIGDTQQLQNQQEEKMIENLQPSHMERSQMESHEMGASESIVPKAPTSGEKIRQQPEPLSPGGFTDGTAEGDTDLKGIEEKTEYSALSNPVMYQEWAVVPVGLPDSSEELKKTKGFVKPEISLSSPSVAENSDGKFFPERFSVGVSLAPDFNSVGFANEKRISGLIGGQLYYQVAPRWIISAGALLNRKKYDTPGEDYQPWEGYWDSQPNGIPENVDGSCQVLDIPLMISYKWTGFQKINIYSSLGISNYLLLDEIYKYEYNTGYSGGSSYGGSGWETEENTWIVAGVINFSAIIGFKLSDQFTVYIEPYLKKPVREVGWGKIDLVSTGTLFTLRYQPFIRKTK